MKKFTEYLAESKKSYTFRVRLANQELNADILDSIERALSAYRLSDITAPKSLPTARCREFMELGPVERCHFEATTDYPAIPPQIQQSIHNATGIPLSHIYVDNNMHDDFADSDEPTSDANHSPILLDPEMHSESAQDSVGEKRVSSLLAELERDKHEPEQYKGVNDNILAKGVHKETKAKTTLDFPMNLKSAIGSVKNKLQGPRGE